jgi:hypothetical protein
VDVPHRQLSQRGFLLGGKSSGDARHAVSETAGSRWPYWLLRTRRADICEIGREHSERRCDDQVVVAASRLQAEPASLARFEDELRKLLAQEIAAGRALGDRQGAAPHGGAEPLDQPRLADDQTVSLRRAGERAIAADQADADVRRCFREKLRSGIAEAALIEDEEVEPGEVRRDQAELLAQRGLRQAHRRADGEPVGLNVEEHERAVIAPAGEVKTGNQLQMRQAHRTSERDNRLSVALVNATGQLLAYVGDEATRSC